MELKIQEYYFIPNSNNRSFYFKASGRLFSLNHSYVLKEIEALPPGIEVIPERDSINTGVDYPTSDFYKTLIDVRTEFGDDITLFLDNGYIVSSYLEYSPDDEISVPVLNFFTKEDIKDLEVSNDRKLLDEVKIELMR